MLNKDKDTITYTYTGADSEGARPPPKIGKKKKKLT